MYYGTSHDRPLELRFVFGANSKRIDRNQPFDRWDLETIASWLTDRDGYRWLEIEQPDMETLRFRCIITDLRFSTVGKEPWAFECRITCDSPFAYTFPEVFKYSVMGSTDIPFFNRSTSNGFFYPQMELYLFGTTFINIINHSDNGRLFSLTDIPNGEIIRINIDNENGVITNNLGHNLYRNFNFNFLRLVRGDNRLEVNGSCNMVITCEFLQNVGG